MTKLHYLNVFVTERLMLTAQEIYKAVEDTISEYHEEIARTRRENGHLKQRLREAGIECWRDPQPIAAVDHAEGVPLLQQCPEEEWSPSDGQEDSEAPLTTVKQELRTTQAEENLQEPVTDESDPAFTPPYVKNEYDQEPPHLFQILSAENSENDSLPSSSFMHIKPEPDPMNYGASEPLCDPQPFCSVNPDTTATQSKASASANGVDIYGRPSEHQAHQTKGPVHARGGPSLPSCAQCPKTFSKLSQLKSHIQSHAHETSVSCKVCGKCFANLGRLNSHVRLHTEAQHLCGVCGKYFRSPGRLKMHQRIHTGEKPYRCHVCGKCFNQTAHLKVHLRVHTGEKPFSCPVCGKCFSQSNKIKRHLQIHTRNKASLKGR